MRKQQKAKDAVQALLPIGIGAEGGNFNKVYRDTFTRIVRNNENIQTVLNEQGAICRQIFNKTGAPCWAPDPPSGKILPGEVERLATRDRVSVAVVTTVAQETPLPRRRRRWEGLPYWLILPTVAYLGLFFVWPMVQGFELAFRDETGNWTSPPFRTMVDDAGFSEAMRFTFLLIARDRARSSSCSRS